MTEEKYQEILKTAPEDHLSEEFKLFLINNNEVVFINENWLVIRNIKYWTEENDWLTAFYLPVKQPWDSVWDKKFQSGFFEKMSELHKSPFADREWLIKAPEKRTVKLFHLHLYKK